MDAGVSVYQVGGLAAGTTYRFRVRAQNAAGFSGYSNVATGATTTGSQVAVHSIVSPLASKCVEVMGGGQLNGTRIFITPCTGAPNRQWTVPPPGFPGDIRMFGTMCFDAYSGQGNPGDRIILWECHGGPNQRWTLTAAGELKGDTGLCVTLNGGATADSTGMAIQPCAGTAAQQWRYGTSDGDQPPVARFTASCTGATCSFTSAASTDDKAIVSRAWNFGDGTTAGNIIAADKTYAAAGTYQVTLTVTDAAGQTGTQSQNIQVGGSPPVNALPVAAFSHSCTNLSCTFTDASTDSDGSIAARSWSFGDGGTSTQTNPVRAYAAAGTYTVMLTVTDDKGGQGSTSKSVSVSAAANVAPVAAFTQSCTYLTCNFTDGSSDSDGTIVSRSWNFGDGGTSTALNPSHAYAAAGAYTVVLNVTDNGGLSGTASKSVTASAPPPITLTATGSKVKGLQKVDLKWTPTKPGNVDVLRGGAKIATAPNTGAYRDNVDRKGAGTYSYRICEAGTSVCSNTVTVTF